MGRKPLTEKHQCPIEETLRIIGKEWTILVLRDLYYGKKRFSEFQRSLKGISPKTLSERLDQLEECELVTKKIFAEIPPRVEYTLTEKGLGFKPVVEALRDYGIKFLNIKPMTQPQPAR